MMGRSWDRVVIGIGAAVAVALIIVVSIAGTGIQDQGDPAGVPAIFGTPVVDHWAQEAIRDGEEYTVECRGGDGDRHDRGDCDDHGGGNHRRWR